MQENIGKYAITPRGIGQITGIDLPESRVPRYVVRIMLGVANASAFPDRKLAFFSNEISVRLNQPENSERLVFDALANRYGAEVVDGLAVNFTSYLQETRFLTEFKVKFLTESQS